MREHYGNPATSRDWGLSVAASPGANEADLLRSARQIRQSHYRVALVAQIDDINTPWERLKDVGVDGAVALHAKWDHNAHGLIVSLNEPTLEIAVAIAAAFGPPKVNPYYMERSRNRVRK